MLLRSRDEATATSLRHSFCAVTYRYHGVDLLSVIRLDRPAMRASIDDLLDRIKPSSTSGVQRSASVLSPPEARARPEPRLLSAADTTSIDAFISRRCDVRLPEPAHACGPAETAKAASIRLSADPEYKDTESSVEIRPRHRLLVRLLEADAADTVMAAISRKL